MIRRLTRTKSCTRTELFLLLCWRRDIDEVSDDTPCERDGQDDEGCVGRELAMFEPPESHQRRADGQPRIEPKGFGEVSVKQLNNHALTAAERTIEASKHMEGAGEHGSEKLKVKSEKLKVKNEK